MIFLSQQQTWASCSLRTSCGCCCPSSRCCRTPFRRRGVCAPGAFRDRSPGNSSTRWLGGDHMVRGKCLFLTSFTSPQRQNSVFGVTWPVMIEAFSSFRLRNGWVSGASSHPHLSGRLWVRFRGAVSFWTALLGEASSGSFWLPERCGLCCHLPRKWGAAEQSKDLLQRSKHYVWGMHLAGIKAADVTTKPVSYSCEMSRPLSFSHWLHLSWQACQLGQHRPICKSHPEGVMKVGTTEGRSMTEQPLSDWFLKMAARDGNNESFNKLKLFAQVCRYDLGNIFTLMLEPCVCWEVKAFPQLRFFFFLSAPYLSEQSLDNSLLSQRNPAVALSLSSSSSQTPSSSSTSLGPQSTNSTNSAQPAQINSTPPSTTSGSQTIGGLASAKPSSYTPFGTTGLQGSTSQNGPQSTPQGAGGLAENGPSANQPQGPSEAPERWVISVRCH